MNDRISVLYGLLRRIDGGVARPDDTIEQARRQMKDLWPHLRSMREAMRVDLGVSGTTNRSIIEASNRRPPTARRAVSGARTT
ncbi:hypothetical protein [Streptomyces sp. NBC_00454]|uniref:hypothetical protein n=1 Tax=Streptomyces sp. NBC_00454 TaxID=2975747 RepID=UPI0030DF19AF